MKFYLSFFIYLFIANYLWSQPINYFDKKKEYHYKVVYIDKNSDTITKEKVIFKPLEKPWSGQPWRQTAIMYMFITDTAGYKNYIDPVDFFRKKDVKYLKKKGKNRIEPDETTGGFINDIEFYIHPPRTNQYRMLFYARHFRVALKLLRDTTTTFKDGMTIPLFGNFKHNCTVTPVDELTIDNIKVKAWKIYSVSDADIKERFKARKIYNSTSDAIFTREFGFIKMYYTFENNIKIQFDLEKIVHL